MRNLKSILDVLPRSPLGLLVAATIGLGFGFSYWLSQYTTTIEHLSVTTQSRKYTLADYEKLTPGMSRIEAQALLGSGAEIRRSADIRIIRWSNSDGSNITATFDNEKLTDKEQQGFESISVNKQSRSR